MKLAYYLLPAGVMLAGCAVTPPSVYGGSVPADTGPAVTSPMSGQIAQCGHAGAPTATPQYPAAWAARMNRPVPSGGGDELLGGPSVTTVVDKDAQPTTLPSPVYPASAASNGVEGICNVLLDVTKDGRPSSPIAACSDPVFTGAALNAISSVQFPPKSVGGYTVERMNVVYPFTFCLS